MAAKWPPSRAGLSQRCVASCQQWTPAAAIAATRVAAAVATEAAAFMRASGSGTAPQCIGVQLWLWLWLWHRLLLRHAPANCPGELWRCCCHCCCHCCCFRCLSSTVRALFAIIKMTNFSSFVISMREALDWLFLLMRVTSSTPSPSPSPAPALFLFLYPSPPHLRWHLQRKSVHE